MPTPPLPPLHDDLTFHGPLSEQRADHLVRTLGPLDHRHIVDLGCGWAELLLRTVAATTTTTGHGVDSDERAVEAARGAANRRGLADRVEFTVGDAGAWSGLADVLVVNGATQVWGGDPLTHTTSALTKARDLLRPGGRLLLGEGFWEREPTADQLRVADIPLGQYHPLPDLVDLAIGQGYRLLAVSQANLDEWDEFESGHGGGYQRWLAGNPDSPDHAEIAARADAHRTAWLRGWRGVLGMAYLTLAVR